WCPAPFVGWCLFILCSAPVALAGASPQTPPKFLPRRDYFAVQHVRFTDCFVQRKFFFLQSEGFRAITGATVSRYSFIKSKHSFGFRCSLLRILEPVFLIAGLDVVMGQLLDGAGKLLMVLLERFSGKSMQAPAANRI